MNDTERRALWLAIFVLSAVIAATIAAAAAWRARARPHIVLSAAGATFIAVLGVEMKAWQFVGD